MKLLVNGQWKWGRLNCALLTVSANLSTLSITHARAHARTHNDTKDRAKQRHILFSCLFQNCENLMPSTTWVPRRKSTMCFLFYYYHYFTKNKHSFAWYCWFYFGKAVTFPCSMLSPEEPLAQAVDGKWVKATHCQVSGGGALNVHVPVLSRRGNKLHDPERVLLCVTST